MESEDQDPLDYASEILKKIESEDDPFEKIKLLENALATVIKILATVRSIETLNTDTLSKIASQFNQSDEELAKYVESQSELTATICDTLEGQGKLTTQLVGTVEGLVDLVANTKQ